MTREEKMKIVINNYFKTECSVNTSIREAFEKGFRIGASKVQKKPEVGTDCISRQAAIDAVNSRKTAEQSSAGIMRNAVVDFCVDIIKKLPPAEPKIVRCKDCKHWIPYDWMFREVWQSKNIADYPEDEIGCNLCDMAMKANDFCSRAERREVQDENDKTTNNTTNA